jgi:prevent-host-death family protein
MKTVTIHEAKTNLSKLIERACDGEEIVIARGSDPVVRLVALKESKKGPRQAGQLKGKFKIGQQFFDPLPDDELEAWGQ